MHIRCPQCHHPVEVVEDDSLKQIDCPSCGSSFNLLSGDETVLGTVTAAGEDPLATAKIAHFELHERLGIGHFGAVWRAHDTKLDRPVAVKIPRREQLDQADAEKFFREARAAAQLNHPNIVSMHEVGREGETIYLVSDLIDGTDLKTRLARRPFTFKEAAELCVTIAEALEHAHQMGIVHRDLKPGNILLDRSGQPHITDFGLAKREAGEITMTVDGQVLGTPAYMSPEQASGRSHEADRRSDVYALGVILYELLTDELPFRGEAQMLVVQILNDEPTPPCRLINSVPRDLETICLKCLEKEPGKRYETAQEFAAELQRYLNGSPIHARPVGRAERYWRWSRRNPIVATLAASVVLSLLIGFVVSTYFGLEANREADEARTARTEAFDLAARNRRLADQEREARLQEAAAGQLANTERERADDRAREAESSARRAEALAGKNANLAAQERLAREAAIEETKRATRLAGENSKLAEIASQREVDALQQKKRADEKRDEAEEQTALVKAHLLSLQHASYNATLMRVQSLWEKQPERAIKLLDNPNLCPVFLRDFAWRYFYQLAKRDRSTLVGHDRGVYDIHFSPDGKQLASGGGDGTLRIRDVATGRQIFEARQEAAHVSGIAFSRDGSAVIAAVAFRKSSKLAMGERKRRASHKGELSVYNAQTGRKQETLSFVHTPPTCVALSPDGRLLACGRASQKNPKSPRKRIDEGVLPEVLGLWDLESGEWRVWLAGHTQSVTSIAFAPDGDTLASASVDGTVRLWSVSTYATLAMLNTDDGPAKRVIFSPNGRRLAAGTRHGLKVWDVATRREVTSIGGRSFSLNNLAFLPDGKSLITAGKSLARQLNVWSVGTGELQQVLYGHETYTPRLRSSGNQGCLAVSPNGSLVASAGGRGGITLWDSPRPEHERLLLGHTEPLTIAVSSPDGRFLATADKLGTVKVLDVKTGREDLSFVPVGGAGALRFSPDSRLLAIMANSKKTGRIHLYDVYSGELSHTINNEGGGYRALAFSPDGKLLALRASGERRIAAGSRRPVKIGSHVQLYDLQTHAVRPKRLIVPRIIAPIAFTPDSATLASGGRMLSLWDVETGDQKSEFRLEWPPYSMMRYSPDGKSLIYDVKRGKRLERLDAGYIVRWDLDQKQVAFVTEQHVDMKPPVTVSPDGKTLASGDTATVTITDASTGETNTTSLAASGVIRLWDAVTGQPRASLHGHKGTVRSVAFLPESDELQSASSSSEGSGDLIVWNAGAQPLLATLKGHLRGVRCVSFSANGQSLATGDGGGRLRIWDLHTGAPIPTSLRDSISNPALTSLAFAEGGQTVAVGTVKGLLRLFDTATGTYRRFSKSRNYRKAGDGPLHAVTFSPDGKAVISSCRQQSPTEDKTSNQGKNREPQEGDEPVPEPYDVKTWNPENGVELSQLTTMAVQITSAVFSVESNRLASVSGDGTITVWDSATGEVQCAIGTKEHRPQSVAFFADGKTLVSGGGSVESGGEIKLWDVARRQARTTLHGHTGSVLCVDVSPDGRMIASGGADANVLLWNAKSGALLGRLTGHAAEVRSIRFSRDGELLASASDDGTVKLWEPRIVQRKAARPASDPRPVVPPVEAPTVNPQDHQQVEQPVATTSSTSYRRRFRLTAHGPVEGPANPRAAIDHLAFSHDGKHLATVSQREIKLWDARTGVLRGTQTTSYRLGGAPAFTSDNGTLVWIDKSQFAEWDLANNKVVRPRQPRDARLSPLSVLSQDTNTYVGSRFPITVRDRPTSSVRARLVPPKLKGSLTGSVRSAVFSADGHRLAIDLFLKKRYSSSPDYDHVVRVWEVDDEESRPATFRIRGNLFLSMAFSWDGGTLALGGRNAIIIRDLQTKKQERVLTKDVPHLNVLAFSPVSPLLASHGAGKSIRVWNWETGQQIAKLPFADSNGVRSFAFSPDGDLLAIGGAGGTLEVLETGVTREKAKDDSTK